MKKFLFVFSATMYTALVLAFSPNDKGMNKKVIHKSVDLGLSVEWATCNVGATKAEECGSYFAWGETEPKELYTDENSKYYGKSTEWLIANAVIDTTGNLSSNHDVATALWGDGWRMPTLSEIKELNEKCTWTWTSIKGMEGFRVTGPNGNSIFLPAAGWFNSASDGKLDCVNERAEYWSATVCFDDEDFVSNSSRCIFFMKPDRHWGDEDNEVQRSRGLCVRAVRK